MILFRFIMHVYFVSTGITVKLMTGFLRIYSLDLGN